MSAGFVTILSSWRREFSQPGAADEKALSPTATSLNLVDSSVILEKHCSLVQQVLRHKERSDPLESSWSLWRSRLGLGRRRPKIKAVGCHALDRPRLLSRWTCSTGWNSSSDAGFIPRYRVAKIKPESHHCIGHPHCAHARHKAV